MLPKKGIHSTFVHLHLGEVQLSADFKANGLFPCFTNVPRKPVLTVKQKGHFLAYPEMQLINRQRLRKRQ